MWGISTQVGNSIARVGGETVLGEKQFAGGFRQWVLRRIWRNFTFLPDAFRNALLVITRVPRF